LAAERQLVPANPSRLATPLELLGRSLIKAGRAAEAETALRESLTLRETHEPEAWTTFQTRSLLGQALLSQNKYADAEPFLLQGFEGLMQHERQVPLHAKHRLTEAVQRLVELYSAWGKPDRAARWRAELERRRAAAPPSNEQ
jgi:hypothetical protein